MRFDKELKTLGNRLRLKAYENFPKYKIRDTLRRGVIDFERIDIHGNIVG